MQLAANSKRTSDRANASLDASYYRLDVTDAPCSQPSVSTLSTIPDVCAPVSEVAPASVTVVVVCLCVSVAVVSGVERPEAQKTAVCRAVWLKRSQLLSTYRL